MTSKCSDRYSLKEDENGDDAEVKADTANELEAEQDSETDMTEQSKPGQTGEKDTANQSQ